MFYYYGGKARTAGHYPPPAYRTIVEPFAGAAGYSMHHLALGNVDRVLLVELDLRVASLWKRLLAMTPDEVLALPVPSPGEITSDFFYMTTATSNGVAAARRMTVTTRMPREIDRQKRRVARLLPFCVGRVEVWHGDYLWAEVEEPATYFVDPPYQVGTAKASSARTGSPQGMGYASGCRSSDLDYPKLADWCRSRVGQVIVAEQSGADWLPFAPLRTSHDSQGRPKTEVVWTGGVPA